ncbi:MAG TPA: hypothetical protein VL096_08225, partial [Pirellulaceae bacterium]|nr:hypothetical protein [Pirellulaceae bacterium]
MTELAAAFVRALDEDRDLLNLRYLQRQRSGQRIDPTAFLWHVEQALAPLVARVEACLPERTRGALVALYEVSLDLFAASQLGPDARLPAVQRLWREVLPHVVPRVLALYPQQVAGCLSNAVVQIGSQRGARPDDWLTTMAQLAPHCASLGELL